VAQPYARAAAGKLGASAPASTSAENPSGSEADPKTRAVLAAWACQGLPSSYRKVRTRALAGRTSLSFTHAWQRT
jgi:hypothetical protein